MKNQAIVSAIRELLNAYNALSGNGDCRASGLKYLIGQMIRQYEVSKSNCHVSQAAMNRWNEIATDPHIETYHYRDNVKCDCLSVPKKYNVYKGASKLGVTRTLNRGSVIQFREMFHEDHVIPVSLIFDALLDLPNVHDTTIKEVLDLMHLCIILKSEDRQLGRTKGRTLDFSKTITEVYNNNGVFLFSR